MKPTLVFSRLRHAPRLPSPILKSILPTKRAHLGQALCALWGGANRRESSSNADHRVAALHKCTARSRVLHGRVKHRHAYWGVTVPLVVLLDIDKRRRSRSPVLAFSGARARRLSSSILKSILQTKRSRLGQALCALWGGANLRRMKTIGSRRSTSAQRGHAFCAVVRSSATRVMRDVCIEHTLRVCTGVHPHVAREPLLSDPQINSSNEARAHGPGAVCLVGRRESSSNETIGSRRSTSAQRGHAFCAVGRSIVA